MSNQKQLYDLNKRAISIRNSKEYIVGNRVLLYADLLRKGKVCLLIKRTRKDLKTRKMRRAESSVDDNILHIDFGIPYTGERMVVYTSIYGNYDKLCEPLFVDPNCDYYILTNQDVPTNSVWKKKEVDFPEDVVSDFLRNRYVKMFPHKVFPDYKYSLYVDGNITIVSEVSLYLNSFHSVTGLAMHKHPASRDLYDEVDACVITGKIRQEEADILKKKLQTEGFPVKYGMFECNIILRDRDNTACRDIMERWWSELLKGAKRDQIHFTYALFKLGYTYKDVNLLGVNMNTNPMFIREKHI